VSQPHSSPAVSVCIPAYRGAAHIAATIDSVLTQTFADFELVIVAACDPNTQVERLMRRDNLTEAEARARIATQWPIGDKVRRADRVIDTNGSIEDTNQQIDETWQALTTKHL